MTLFLTEAVIAHIYHFRHRWREFDKARETTKSFKNRTLDHVRSRPHFGAPCAGVEDYKSLLTGW